MSLFTKSIHDVDIHDVLSFCKEGIEEGIRVSYKGRWTDHVALAKELASFANTRGGLLLIGISEEAGKPIVPFPGIDSGASQEEKITAVAFQGVNPPVFPEIAICQLQDRPDKSVIVIRVPESSDTPHRVEEDTKVYVRSNGREGPVLAPFEEVELLMNRRKRAIDNGVRIVSRAKARFFEKYKIMRPEAKPDRTRAGAGLHSSANPQEYVVPPTRGISVMPLYARDNLAKYHDLKGIIAQSTTPYFPDYRSFRKDVSLQDSIIYSNDDKTVSHTEINSFGLVFHREDFALDERNHLEEKDVIDIHLTLQMIYAVLSFAVRFYETIGFWGTVAVTVSFDHILGKRLFSESLANNYVTNEFDDKLHIERKATVTSLVEHRDDLVIDIYREVFWSLGAQGAAASPNLKNILEKVKGGLV